MIQTATSFFQRKTKELGVTLNETQIKAVLQTEGPMLILACPGSGKTTTIIMRIGYLIEEMKVNPARIKAVTFSRASVTDMQERFRRFFPNTQQVEFSTIHSLAFEIVRDHFRATHKNYQIIEGPLGDKELSDYRNTNAPLNKKVILNSIFESIVHDRMTEDQMDELTTYISYVKNKMIPQSKWSTVSTDVPKAKEILQAYESFKKSFDDKILLDFDDMLVYAAQVLVENEDLLRVYQRRFDYILTDESQDTSTVQHTIVEKLAAHHQNLCVVADDDQSIYSWRGAEPDYLLNFKKVYPTAEILFMEQNYRSTKDIVEVSNVFIQQNSKRYKKNMFTQNTSANPIKMHHLPDYIFQARYLVERLKEVEDLSEVAILYRNNASSIVLINEFDRAEIPFFIKDTDHRFFSHWVVKDILNFMRMSFTDKRLHILEEICFKMNSYISRQQIESIRHLRNGESVFDNLLKYGKPEDYQKVLLKENKNTFMQMKGMPPLEAIQVIRNRLGYEKAIGGMCERLGMRLEYLVGILNQLEEIAEGLETMAQFAERLKYLEGVVKTSKHKNDGNAVTLSTLHSAKGLEFEQVYMIDLVDSVIPSREDHKNPDLMEEARRLFYVGMTRAKKDLELISYRRRDGESTEVSSFVTHVKNIIAPPICKGNIAGASNVAAVKAVKTEFAYEAKIGRKVYHPTFGEGVIESVGNDLFTASFKSGTKKLSTKVCGEMGWLG